MGCPALKAWPGDVLFCLSLALSGVFQEFQASLDSFKLRAVESVFLPGGKRLLNLLLGLSNAVFGDWVRGECLRQETGLAFLLCLHLLEKGDKGGRIVARLVKVLKAKKVSFPFSPSVEAHHLQ